jgi:hypothetical protein
MFHFVLGNLSSRFRACLEYALYFLARFRQGHLIQEHDKSLAVLIQKASVLRD